MDKHQSQELDIGYYELALKYTTFFHVCQEKTHIVDKDVLVN
jgi:hypothetical protein